MEVELKYRVNDPATGERLLSADQLGGLQATGGRARATQFEDRYVDTSVPWRTRVARTASSNT